MKHMIAKLLLVVYLLPTLAFAQSPETQIKRVENGLLPPVNIKGEPGWSITERMKFHKVPGLSIAVIKDFKVEWAKAYGLKDVASNEPVTTDTLFQAGSISKSVNAMVAMKKMEQGRIALDDNINNKLTSWKLPDNELTANKKVTLRRLLSHTAGTTVHGFPGYAVNAKVPSLPQVLDGASPANTAAVRVDLEPGTRVRYSGGGTTITQLAIMDIEKKPYPEIARETVLGPLGMTNSTYSQPLPPDWRKKAATGYQFSGEEIEGKIHVYPEMAAAGLWTTPTDLAKFAIEMQLSIVGRSNKVLTKESATLMTTPVLENAGLGFFMETYEDAVYFGHGGADEGFRAELVVSRDKGYGVVVMVNSDNGQILREVIRGVAFQYGWDKFLPPSVENVTVEQAKLERYTGRFQVNLDRVLTISIVSAPNTPARLRAQPTLDQPFDLFATTDTTFARRESNVKYEFTGSEGAAAPSIRIAATGGSNELKRIGADTLVPLELLLSGKVTEAVEAYRQIRKNTPQNASLAENRLNGVGYALMEQKKVAEAIVILKLTVELYPTSANAYDSLAEAYAANGDKELAITNFRKSLELNPNNESAKTQLKKLAP